MSELNVNLKVEDKHFLSLYEKGNFDQLLRSTTKKIKLGKKSANNFVLRGLALNAKEKFTLAQNDFLEAKKLGAKNAIIEPLIKKNQLNATFIKYLEAFLIDEDNKDNLFDLGITLTQLDPNSTILTNKTRYKQLSLLFIKLMDTNGSVIPTKLGPIVYKHIKADPEIINFQDHIANENKGLSENQLNLLERLSVNPLLKRILSYCVCTDRRIEIIIRLARRYFLSIQNDIKISQQLFEMMSGISIQMFLNEYVYDISDEEVKIVSNLLNEVERDLSNNKSPDERTLLKISLYQELSIFNLTEHRKKLSRLEQIFQRHIDNKNDEKLIAETFKKNDLIQDTVSERVRRQYEENPFPRWENTKFNRKPLSLESIIQSQQTKLKVHNLFAEPTLKALVAGCGTGREPIVLAKNIKNIKVDAIDLSIKSLSYAKRKADELNLQNIDFIHQDILNLANTKKKYHIIHSSGVLHHMDKPSVGLGILSNLLEDEGYMHIALYSTQARRGFRQIQDAILTEKNLEPDLKTIRELREFLFARAFKDTSIYPVTNMVDLFSTSQFRDLLFHEQEHTFSLLEIRDLLEESELEFCGFSLTSELPTQGLDEKTFFELEKWHEIEQQNPNLFIGMYQFYCQKKH